MRPILFALSSALILASCGPDGSGGSPSGTPTPSPSPAPTPTPTPTPVASYSTFDGLTGDQTYPTGCVSLQILATPFLPPKRTISPATDFGNGLQFTYTAATQIRALNGDGVSVSFSPTDYSAINSGADTDAWLKSVGSDYLRLKAPTWAGTRMVYNRVFYLDTKKDNVTFSYTCITGVPTLAFDVPTLGTADFPKIGFDATAVFERAGNFNSADLTQTVVSFQADFTAKKVTVVLHLILTGTDLGTVTGSGTIDGATGRFSGSWSSTDHTVTGGNFAGSFFGPQAQEFGLTYRVQEQVFSTSYLSSYGAITGSR